jgi:hypothetical protein
MDGRDQSAHSTRDKGERKSRGGIQIETTVIDKDRSRVIEEDAWRKKSP